MKAEIHKRELVYCDTQKELYENLENEMCADEPEEISQESPPMKTKRAKTVAETPTSEVDEFHKSFHKLNA
jgi:hypothetical protein